jgi:hypothetical protein
MTLIYFGNFHAVVKQHINEIDMLNPEFQSTEWYLLQYLRRIEKNTDSPVSTAAIDNSIRALIRFYVDSIDEHSPLGDHCIRVYQEYRKTIRTSKKE